jgi:hypothetical protein
MPKIAADEWSFFFPSDGENKSHAIPIIGRIGDAEHAAREACIYDWQSRHGEERYGSEFDITVVSPEGEETTFVGWHQPSIEHKVMRAKSG